MDKPLTQLKYFFKLADERELSGSDQLLWFHLFNRFNKQNWKGTLKIKDAELRDLMKLYDSNGKPVSVATIRRARQRLKTKGFIEFSSGGGYATTYELLNLAPDEEEDKPVEPKAKILPLSVSNDLTVNSDAVNQVWSECNGEHLKGGKAALMIQLEKEFGTQKLIEAIRQAYYAHDYERFGAQLKVNLVKAILENLQEGGEKRGNNRASRTSSESSYYNVDCANQPLPPGY